MAKRRWYGQLRIEGETAWWSGSAGDATAHRHYAAQAVFSEDVLHAVDEEGREVSGICLLIEPGVRHLLLPTDNVEICYVEPTAAFGPSDTLRKRMEAGGAQVLSGSSARPFWLDWIARLTRPSIDTRVVRAIAEIETLLPAGTVRLADICAVSELSEGRFRHLFAAQMGLPFQRFVLWRRLGAAFASLLAGDTVTEAAHAAGFADAAHFARTIKAMFGIRASDIFLER